MRKTEVCIYEATYSRQSDASRLLGWFQNKVESPLQHQVPPTLNSADWIELEEMASIGSVLHLPSSAVTGKKRNAPPHHPKLKSPGRTEQQRSVGIMEPVCRHGERLPHLVCRPSSIPLIASANLFNQGPGWSRASLGAAPQQAEQNSSGGAISKNCSHPCIGTSRERSTSPHVSPNQMLAKMLLL